MFCNYCGKQIPEGGNLCPFCGKLTGRAYAMGRRSRINNIFSALVSEKTPGAITEFILWCAACVSVLLSFLAVILVDGGWSKFDSSYRLLWIFIMLFEIGLGVIMAFRLKPIALLYSVTAFLLIMLIPFYVTNVDLITTATDYYDGSLSGIVIAVFVLALLAGLGAIVCSIIQFFTRIKLGLVSTVLTLVASGLSLLLIIFIYAIPCTDSECADEIREVLGKVSYWLGSLSFLLALAITAVFFAMFFLGCIDSSKDKIYVANPATRMPAGQIMPGIQCIQGAYMGKVFYLQGGEFVIGSQSGVHIQIQDPYVSHRHCSVRFNAASGVYEVLDSSTNGVYMSNGAKLQSGVYNMCSRGSVICIGSAGQQFRLL